MTAKDITTMTDATTVPTTAERREQTVEHLRASIVARAPKAAEAITAAVDRLDMVDLIRAAVFISDLADLAAGDEDDDCEPSRDRVMSTIADLLNPSSRHQLERLADPEDQDLAAAARDAAMGSTGTGRTAWLVVAMALDLGDGTAETARGIMDALVHDDRVRHLAQACLTMLTADDATTEGTT